MHRESRFEGFWKIAAEPPNEFANPDPTSNKSMILDSKRLLCRRRKNSAYYDVKRRCAPCENQYITQKTWETRNTALTKEKKYYDCLR